MAGIFGMFDYTKPGKGVRKDEPQKPRFLHFWELFIRKFWKLIQLNLLYILFCIPIVTIGPATAGMTYVLRNMANEQPIFLFSDFWDAFKANWKQSLVYSLLLAAAAFLLRISIEFYMLNAETYKWMLIPAALSLFVALMIVLSCFYVMLMIVTLDLPLKDILKNSVLLSILCLKTNLLTLLFAGLLLFAVWLFMPYTILLILLIIPAMVGFIICYNSFKGIKTYAIDPYLAKQEEAEDRGEAEPDGSLFSDETPTDTVL